MGISGYLNLGTGLSGNGVVAPPTAAGYMQQIVTFEDAPGGVTVNSNSCVFGPLVATWGTLTCFDVTDFDGNPLFTGPLRASLSPSVGELVTAPPGNISIVLFQTLFSNGGILTTVTGIFPSSETDLLPGDIWSNGGVLNVVPGYMSTEGAAIYFGEVSAAQLLAAGAFSLPTTAPQSGSKQLYIVGAEIWIA